MYDQGGPDRKYGSINNSEHKWAPFGQKYFPQLQNVSNSYILFNHFEPHFPTKNFKNFKNLNFNSNSQFWLWMQTRYLLVRVLVLLCKPVKHSKNPFYVKYHLITKKTDEYDTWRYERHLISWHTRHSRPPKASNSADMVHTMVWYGSYQTSFCHFLSWVGFVSILNPPKIRPCQAAPSSYTKRYQLLFHSK